MLRRLWFNVGKVATGPVASGTKYQEPGLKLPGYDPKRAVALLDEAGLKPNAQGVRFSIRHLTLPYGEVWTRLAEYLRTAFKAVGVELVLESSDTGGWASRVAEWNYDTTVNFLYQYGDPTLGVERTYVSTNIQKIVFTNTGGYKNPKVDELFAQARAAAGPEGQAGCVHRGAEASRGGDPASLDHGNGLPDVHGQEGAGMRSSWGRECMRATTTCSLPEA